MAIYVHGSWDEGHVNDREVDMRKNLIIVVFIVVAVLASSAAVSRLGAQSRATAKENSAVGQKGTYLMVADSKEGVWVLDANGGRVKYCSMNDFGSVTCSSWSSF
jgi:flagellar basal body-associated protein FliL